MRVRPGAKFEELSVWELVYTLVEQGWSHYSAPKKLSSIDAIPLAYDPASSEKCFFTRRGADKLCEPYLRLLCLGEKVVPHFKPHEFYVDMYQGDARKT